MSARSFSFQTYLCLNLEYVGGRKMCGRCGYLQEEITGEYIICTNILWSTEVQDTIKCEVQQIKSLGPNNNGWFNKIVMTT